MTVWQYPEVPSPTITKAQSCKAEARLSDYQPIIYLHGATLQCQRHLASAKVGFFCSASRPTDDIVMHCGPSAVLPTANGFAFPRTISRLTFYRVQLTSFQRAG